ncbi:MAG: 50S ribosomal protein L29 [Rickettsiales bacterium]|jgi:ribosomal protein L29|nr:50S ribosomal protein L29 [Rickettsiales bacterium]
MKDKMEIAKFKSSDAASIKAKILELKRTLMEKRFALSNGTLPDTSSISNTRRALARLNTYMTQATKKKPEAKNA